MSEPNRGRNFWLGNAVMVVAMGVLLAMGKLWEIMGVGAMVLWVALAAAGAYLLMRSDRDGP